MPRKKEPEGTSILVVIKGRGGRAEEIQDSNSLSKENVAYLSPVDLDCPRGRKMWLVPDDFSHYQSFLWMISKPISSVSFIGSDGTSKQLQKLINGVQDLISPSSSAFIGGFRVSKEQFKWLADRFENLHFVQCHFGRGWWSPNPSSRCDTLTLDSCTGANVSGVTAGQAGWSMLTNLYVSGPDRPLTLRRGGFWKPSSVDREATEAFVRPAVKVFWGDRLECAIVTDLNSLDFLVNLPVRPKMESLWLWSPVTAEVFLWALQHSKLESLHLSWESGVKLPWTKLSSLKRLWNLSVKDSPLDDEQLKEIAKNAKLTHLSSWYSDLTSSSWPVILSWPTLRSFWASGEMGGTELPEDLPETTNLKQFLGMNAKMEWFKQLLSRYPGVEIDSA